MSTPNFELFRTREDGRISQINVHLTKGENHVVLRMTLRSPGLVEMLEMILTSDDAFSLCRALEHAATVAQ